MTALTNLLDGFQRHSLAIEAAFQTRTAPNSNKLGTKTLAEVLQIAQNAAVAYADAEVHDLVEGQALTDMMDYAFSQIDSQLAANQDIRSVPTYSDLPAVGSDTLLYVVRNPVSLYCWVGGQYRLLSSSQAAITNTDGLAEGTNNLYFTPARAVSAFGYSPENPANKNVANGYVGLDSGAKIPATYLPSYVDDVVEYTTKFNFPGTGESGKLYVALNDGKVYRWGGSSYVEITAAPGSTDAVPEGSSNLYFTVARVLAAFGYTPENPANKNAQGGYAGLDSNTRVPVSQLANLLAGVNTWSARQTFGAATHEKHVDLASGLNIDLALANSFGKTVSANTTFTISNNVAAGSVASFVLHITNGGAFTINWWAAIKWAGGTAPALSATGRDVIAFSSTDGGATWDGYLVGKDMK